MRRLTLLVVALSVVLGGGAGVRAQEESKDRKIRKLLVLTGEVETAVKLCHQSLNEQRQNPNLPPGYIKRFKELANETFFADLFAPVYAKHFDEDDIDKLIAFYATPVGKKLMRERSAIQKEAGEAAETAGMKLGMKVLEELQKDDEEDAPKPRKKKPDDDEDEALRPKKKDGDEAPKPKKDGEPKAKEPL